MARPDEWILEDFNDALDVSDMDGAIQIRDHFVVSRHKKISAATYSGPRSDVGTTSASLQFYVGSILQQKSLPVGVNSKGRWICVADGESPEQPGSPGEYKYRRQTWEYYSAWRDPPDGWGL